MCVCVCSRSAMWNSNRYVCWSSRFIPCCLSAERFISLLCSVHRVWMCLCVLPFRELSLIVDASLLHHFISRIYFDEIVFGWAKYHWSSISPPIYFYFILFYFSSFFALGFHFYFYVYSVMLILMVFKIFRIWIFRNFHSNCLPSLLVSESFSSFHDPIRSSFALGLAAIELYDNGVNTTTVNLLCAHPVSLAPICPHILFRIKCKNSFQ